MGFKGIRLGVYVLVGEAAVLKVVRVIEEESLYVVLGIRLAHETLSFPKPLETHLVERVMVALADARGADSHLVDAFWQMLLEV